MCFSIRLLILISGARLIPFVPETCVLSPLSQTDFGPGVAGRVRTCGFGGYGVQESTKICHIWIRGNFFIEESIGMPRSNFILKDTKNAF